MSTTSRSTSKASNSRSSPINPFKHIRTTANLSQYEISRRAKVSKHAVLRLEQGMYAEPLPSLVSYFVNNYNVSRLSLLQQYEQFQVETRANNARLLGDLITDTPVGVHPLTYLRSKAINPEAGEPYNVTSLSKALCLNQTVIAYFEKHPVQQHTVPEQLVIALHDADYTEDETNWLKHQYEAYRDSVINSQSFKVVELGAAK